MSGLRLRNVEGLGIDDIRDEIEQGARFVIYRYAVSLIIVTFMRPTDIYFISPGESRVKGGLGFTALTLLLGWWGLPWGPIRAIQAITVNLRGGVDVTADIMSSLDARAAPGAEFNFSNVHNVFEPVGDHNRAAIAGALLPLFDAYGTIDGAYTGVYMDTNGEQPWFVIGVEGTIDIERMTGDGLARLGKKYSKRVRFEFMSLGEDPRSAALVEQGERIYGK